MDFRIFLKLMTRLAAAKGQVLLEGQNEIYFELIESQRIADDKITEAFAAAAVDPAPFFPPVGKLIELAKKPSHDDFDRDFRTLIKTARNPMYGLPCEDWVQAAAGRLGYERVINLKESDMAKLRGEFAEIYDEVKILEDTLKIAAHREIKYAQPTEEGRALLKKCMEDLKNGKAD